MDSSDPDFLWAKWNMLTSAERCQYIEHIRMLMDRGYLILAENDPENDEVTLAMKMFAYKLKQDDAKKKEVVPTTV